MPPYQLPVEIAADLRPYQREGISWLAFLRRSGLHGVLADDMGAPCTAASAACTQTPDYHVLLLLAFMHGPGHETLAQRVQAWARRYRRHPSLQV